MTTGVLMNTCDRCGEAFEEQAEDVAIGQVNRDANGKPLCPDCTYAVDELGLASDEDRR